MIDNIIPIPLLPLKYENNIGKAFYTTKVKGTGLGVMLSKEIIELHDGNLIYTSNKNEGTCVDIILPTIEI